MRKVIWWMFVTLDGFISGPNGELDWAPGGEQNPDKEIDLYSYEKLGEMDTILLGSRTYELFVDFWPTATTDEEIIADRLNAMHKIVFSRTLDHVEWGQWGNVRLAKGAPAQEVSRLKQEPGKDIVMFGSANLAQSFISLGLIDEYRLFVVPVVLGSGRPLFENVADLLRLRFVGLRSFGSGVVLLCYEPAS